MIVLDTGALYAAMDANEPLHGACVAALAGSRPPRLLSPFVLAELDYLVGRRIGRAGQAAVLDEVVRGAYRLEPFGVDDVREAQAVLARWSDLDLGIADASVLVLANRHRTLDVLTTDLWHFRALRGAGDRPLRLLPADAHD
ncbi:MAG: PIN domain-containing protein [Myxococcota bacterium]